MKVADFDVMQNYRKKRQILTHENMTIHFFVGILDVRNKLYEADIVLSDEEKEQVDQREEGDADGPGAAKDLIKRNAVRKSRVVPYRISPALCMCFINSA